MKYNLLIRILMRLAIVIIRLLTPFIYLALFVAFVVTGLLWVLLGVIEILFRFVVGEKIEMFLAEKLICIIEKSAAWELFCMERISPMRNLCKFLQGEMKSKAG